MSIGRWFKGNATYFLLVTEQRIIFWDFVNEKELSSFGYSEIKSSRNKGFVLGWDLILDTEDGKVKFSGLLSSELLKIEKFINEGISSKAIKPNADLS